jgi:Sperm-tail PG-rich repeat
VSKSLLENPAPGNYELSPKKGGPQYSFAKSAKKNPKNETPGPGNYNGDFTSLKNKTASTHFGEVKRKDQVP